MLEIVLSVIGVAAIIIVGVILLVRWFLRGPNPGPLG
jgi:hypothetical protein